MLGRKHDEFHPSGPELWPTTSPSTKPPRCSPGRNGKTRQLGFGKLLYIYVYCIYMERKGNSTRPRCKKTSACAHTRTRTKEKKKKNLNHYNR